MSVLGRVQRFRNVGRGARKGSGVPQLLNGAESENVEKV
jgi:hypothetical protein